MRATTVLHAWAAAALATALLVPATAAATTVCIDPGHGGPYSNANANGLREKDVNLWVALEVRDALKADGLATKMTRTSDRAVGLSDRPTWNWNRSTRRYEYRKDGRRGSYTGIPRDDLQARVDYANKAGADLFVSIHCNGASSRAAHGTETWASSRDPLGRELSTYVQRSVVRATGLRDRGSFRAEFYVLRWSNMPAVLVENAFITNPSEARLLKSKAFRAKLGGAIADGITDWLATRPFDRVWPRYAGATPFATSTSVSRASYPSGSSGVVIVRADEWLDAGTAPVLAARTGRPLLFVTDTVPPETAVELARLSPSSLTLVGPDGSFDETLTAQIAAAANVTTSSVESIAGRERFAVAASAAKKVGVPASGEIVLVYYGSPESIMQASAYAARKRAPLLLSWYSGLGGSTSRFVADNRSKIRKVTVFGNTRAIAPKTLVGLPNVNRMMSSDRAWWAAMSGFRFPRPGYGKMRPVIVDAKQPLDRLAAAAYAARRNQPLLLTEAAALPNTTRAFITYRAAWIGGFDVVNTAGSIPSTMDWNLRKADQR